MDGYLKASTAAFVLVGPYLSTDGLTPKANLKISVGVFQIGKNGAAFANKTATAIAASSGVGWYRVPLSSADVTTIGNLQYKSSLPSATKVFGSYVVLPKVTYSGLFGAGYLPVNAVQVNSATPDTKGGIAASVKSLGVTVAAGTLSAGVFKSTAIPAQGAPPAATNLPTQMSYVYKFMRNKVVATAGLVKVYDDAGTTVDHKATITDDGTTFTRAEFISGA